MKTYRDYWPGFSFYFTVGKWTPPQFRMDRDGLRIAGAWFALAIYTFDLERKLGFLMRHYLEENPKP